MLQRVLLLIISTSTGILVSSQPPDHIRADVLYSLMRSSRPYQNALYTRSYYRNVVPVWRSGAVLAQMEAEQFQRHHQQEVLRHITTTTAHMTDIRPIQKTIENELKKTVRPKL